MHKAAQRLLLAGIGASNAGSAMAAGTEQQHACTGSTSCSWSWRIAAVAYCP